MRKSWLLLMGASFLFLPSCQPPIEEKAEGPSIDLAAEEQAIRSLLDDYVTAKEQEDMELYARVLAHDSEMVNIAPGANAYFVGWDSLKKAVEAEFAMVTGTKINTRDLKIIVQRDGKIAWATARWDWQANVDNQPMQLSGRVTFIFEKREAGWIIVHFHGSVGMGEDGGAGLRG